jgi:predicted TPR repeat methyltransferase
MTYKEDYQALDAQYLDPDSLMYQKMRLVDRYISKANTLLDIGTGTGELIELEKHKFKRIWGIDTDTGSIEICRRRFGIDQKITLMACSLLSSESHFESVRFDYIACLDVLEHMTLADCKKTLRIIENLLSDDGRLIFTGPGLFEKIRIRFGWSHHIHSHSSYGWKRLIQDAGLRVFSVETVRFPVIHRDFLRRRFHLFGECCLIVAGKRPTKLHEDTVVP